jgi:hypothetical protein
LQEKNPAEKKTCYSHDEFCEVDDDKDILKNMFSETAMNSFTKTGIPPHALHLKEGDVCVVTRAMAGIPTNTRVRINTINKFTIFATTLNEKEPRQLRIPRIRFKFRLRYGASFQILRTQFPLRLAYAMTYNRVQGQTLDRVLLDITTAPFSHGHLYVGSSRNTQASDIRLFLNPDTDLYTDPLTNVEMPLVTNVVYPQLRDLVS